MISIGGIITPFIIQPFLARGTSNKCFNYTQGKTGNSNVLPNSTFTHNVDIGLVTLPMCNSTTQPECKYRILTEFKVFMYWKDPPRANRGAEPRSGEALRFLRAGLSST